MPRAPNENVEKAKELFDQGKKMVEISTTLNVPEGTIRSWKKRYNWDCNVANIKRNVANKNNEKRVKQNTSAPEVESVIENPDLNDKQRAFCLYYLKNFNATLAAIKAGYSSETASQIGYQLLQKTSVRKEIKALKEMKCQAIMIDESDIIERYMNIAFADMTDFMEFGCIELPIRGEDGAPIEVYDEATGVMKMLTEPANILSFKSSKEVDGGLICEISQGKNGTKLKLEDRQKALDWLSKYFIMNPIDKHKIEFDNKKFELEAAKLNNDPETYEDDGFIEALKGDASEVWDDPDD